MEEESSGLPLFPVVAALLVVLVAGGFYVIQLRSENAALRTELATARQQPATERAESEVAAGTEGPALTTKQRNAMLSELRNETSPVRDVWFAYSPNDAESLAFQRNIQEVFEEAGWTVRRSAPAGFTVRPGIYFLMADESPPPHVLTALAAFNATGLEVSAGRDYRSFYASKKAENPNWRGFEMAPDQAYIVAVGRSPGTE